MTTITFDTLAYSNKLQSAGVPRAQAEALTNANADALKDMIHAHDIATKQDLAILKQEMDASIARTKAELEIAIERAKHSTLKWIVTAMIAQTALLVGIIAFLK